MHLIWNTLARTIKVSKHYKVDLCSVSAQLQVLGGACCLSVAIADDVTQIQKHKEAISPISQGCNQAGRLC